MSEIESSFESAAIETVHLFNRDPRTGLMLLVGATTGKLKEDLHALFRTTEISDEEKFAIGRMKVQKELLKDPNYSLKSIGASTEELEAEIFG